MLGVRSVQQGDTMIEVLLAVTIFSIVAVTGLTVMNQGSAAAQRSLEITLVRNEMEAQAKVLRFMYDDAVAQKNSLGYNAAVTADTATPAGRWQQVLDLRKTAATPFSDMVVGTTCFAPDVATTRAFVINPRTARLYTQSGNPASWSPANLYSRIRFTPATSATPHSPTIQAVEGLWIEGVRRLADPTRGVPGYTDFHIRACWTTVGQAQPVTLGTIVRLYEPTF